MKQLVVKYARKLVDAGLAEDGAPVVGGLDDELVWNRHDARRSELAKVFGGLNINALLFSLPAEPYRSMIDYLASMTAATDGAIRPNDSETRTILHDLPVVEAFDAGQIVAALERRKCAILPGHGVVTWGMVSPEQAFVFYSSVCFACFVKFMSDYLADRRSGGVSRRQQRVMDTVMQHIDLLPSEPPTLMQSPFLSEPDIYRAVSQAGRMTVDYGLVDSFFGNVSLRCGDTLYISQTTSSLDELDGCIDPCPLDSSSCAGITASSELTAHREIVQRTEMDAILHGHPKFSVILSMDCEKTDCAFRGQCHIRCPESRFIEDIPIVPGEVGTGPHGLCHTLPPAMEGRRGVIVYGHGLFTVGREDFNEAFANLLAIERLCQETYLRMVS
jgi:ribulose-5-phosphate 4-epimerase/fuculose-1-phosphate aldolase